MIWVDILAGIVALFCVIGVILMALGHEGWE